MATMTITTTGAQDTRIIAAFRARYGQDKTAVDIKTWLIGHLKALVHSYETEQAAVAAAAGVTEITPT